MTTINWERESGERIEDFVAAYILMTKGRGNQVRPSQGDHGIDVEVFGQSGWDIYQVKRYASNLTARQKSEIARSWVRFRADVLPNRPIRSWSLVLPLEPTPENLQWLANLTAGCGIEVNWIGRALLDGWAAESPQLVGYYFGDGEARLRQLMSFAISGTQPVDGESQGESLLGSIGDRVANLSRALDEVDPFYRYDIHLRPGKLDDAPDLSSIRNPAPGLVMSTEREVEGDRVLVTRIFARSPASTSLRPIQQTLAFPADSESPERAALEEFMHYGAPFSAAAGEIVETSGPPGTTVDGGTLLNAWVFAPDNDRLPPLEARLIDTDGSVSQVVHVTRAEASTAVLGPGFWLRVHLGPAASIEFFAQAEGRDDQLRISTDKAIGSDPSEVADAVRFVANLPGKSVQLAVRGGTPITPALHIGENAISAGAAEYVRLIDALSVVQSHSLARVRVPDLSESNEAEVRELIRLTALLEGFTVTGQFGGIGIADSAEFEGWGEAERRLTMELPITVRIADHVWDTNMNEKREFASVRVDRSGAHLRLLPGADAGITAVAVPRT